MPSIWSMMDIGRWALNTSQARLTTVSHNVANADTPGYSRQETVVSTQTPEQTGEGYYGRGVQIDGVIQHVDKLLLERITDKTSAQEYSDALLAQLQRLESLSNEAGDTGLGAELTKFFNAWQDVSDNPQSDSVRQVLIETTNNLTTRFQTLIRDITVVERDLDTYVSGAVSEINSRCRRIAELNSQIGLAEGAGQSANDLRDERVNQLNALSEYIGIQWFEGSDGMVTVVTGDGKVLVQKDTPKEGDVDPLTFKTVAGYSGNQVVWRDSTIVMTDDEVTAGRLGAWLRMRDTEIPDMKDFLNDLSSSLIWEVNSQHSQGAGLTQFTDVTGHYLSSDQTTAFNDSANTLPYADKITDGTFDIWVEESGTRRKYTVTVQDEDDLQTFVQNFNTAVNPGGNPSDNPVATVVDGNKLRIYASGGIKFSFANDTSNILAAMGVNTFFEGQSASSISLNTNITDDSGLIAAGRLSATGELASGSNSNALDLADLKDQDTMNTQTETFNESVITWAANLGTRVAVTQSSLSFSQVANNELKDLRGSVSGVNLDEEMVKMIQFQRSYQMASKVIATADELLAALLQLKG